MNTLVPGYLFPYVLIGSSAAVAAVLFGLRRFGARSLSALLLTWFFVALLLSWSGFYQGAPSRFPTLPFGLVIPIAAGIILYWRWPSLQRVIGSVPQSWIVSVQSYRVLGLIFLVLYAAGRMPGAFALPAGVGDILVGVLAPVV